MNPSPAQYTIPVYRLQLVQEGQATTMPVTGPAELAFHLKEIATADREHMVVVFLDTKNRPIGRQVVSIGTLNATLVEPREVFKSVLLANANGVILVHNLCDASHKLCCVKRRFMCSENSLAAIDQEIPRPEIKVLHITPRHRMVFSFQPRTERRP